MHRQSLRDTLERARKLCLEAEVRLESPSDLLEDGVSRWTWISSRLWEGYSDLEDLGARLPQEAKPKPSPRQITPQELGKVINEALTAAAAAIQAEDARMAALQGQAVSGQPAPTRLSDNQAEQTRALLRALWLGTEIAKTLAKSP